MKVRFNSRLFLPFVLALLVVLLACGQDEGASTPPSATPSPPSAGTVKPLSASDREAIDEFAARQQAIEGERQEFYQEFDEWRAGLTACHPSAAQEVLQEFAAEFAAVTGLARNLPRFSSTKGLADMVIPAVEAEEAAYRQLRDRWQPGDVDLFEVVELRRSEAARAQEGVEDRALELRERFEEGPTHDEVEEMEAFSETFDDLADAWNDFHDAYDALRKREMRLDIAELIAGYDSLVEQFSAIVESIAGLTPTELNEDIIGQLLEAAADEQEALIYFTEALSMPPPSSPAPGGADGEMDKPEIPGESDAGDADTSAADNTGLSPSEEPQTGGPSAGEEEAPAPVPGEPDSGIDLGLLQEEFDAAYHRSQAILEEVEASIKEIVDGKSAENLEHLKEFESDYKALLVEWNAFRDSYNEWRNTGGGCDRVETLGDLAQFSQQAGDLGRQVRELPQSGFLLPIYTLLAEAAEREEAAMRALHNSWRPFSVDAFIAVDEERAYAARLRRQAGIGLQELRDRP